MLVFDVKMKDPELKFPWFRSISLISEKAIIYYASDETARLIFNHVKAGLTGLHNAINCLILDAGSDFAVAGNGNFCLVGDFKNTVLSNYP